MVSDTVVFEYKPAPASASSSPTSAPLTSLDLQKFSLLQRLQRLHGRMQVKIEPMDESSQVRFTIKVLLGSFGDFFISSVGIFKIYVF